jgi:SAM-dependent methyltransferase
MSVDGKSMRDRVSTHYDATYFDWQASIGEFGGWANLAKFLPYLKETDEVLDFGCGGGFLLRNIACRKRVGVEVNPSALSAAVGNGIEGYRSVDDVPDRYVDVVISNHALEHTLRPLDELRTLRQKLRPGGRIVFVVPCESIRMKYKPNDVSHHLYTWSPLSLGNLFAEAGFTVIESRPYIHKWPPGYRQLARVVGRKTFDLVCRIYGHLERSWFQVRVIGHK